MKNELNKLKARLRFEEGESKKLGFMLSLERDKCKKLNDKIDKINMILNRQLEKAEEGYNATDCNNHKHLNYYLGQIDTLNEFKDNIKLVMYVDRIFLLAKKKVKEENHEKRTK